jgi:hypothetical protein
MADTGSLDDPEFQKRLFTQAFEQTCKLLDDPQLDTLRSLIHTHRGRDQMLDQTTAAHAKAGKAECGAGCAFCCHQMVLCTPFEIFSIAQYLFTTKTLAEIAVIKDRLAILAPLPLEARVRYDAKHPCALLENDRCTIYEQRPSACRTLLSASRTACRDSLAANSGTVPFIIDPARVSSLLQLAIDFALVSRANLFIERVELSRALLIALTDFDAVLARWGNGENPFPDCQPAQSISSRDMAETAAKRFGVS